ncbi:MAG: hypothetical protein ACQEQL_04085 [Pseudomonadota bacterium]
MGEDNIFEALMEMRPDKKPPLVFCNVEIPAPTDQDEKWLDKFQKYARRQNSKKCAHLMENAVKAEDIWRIAAGLAHRHQQDNPDSIFSYNTPVRQGLPLDSYIWLHRGASDTAREMLLTGLAPQKTDLRAPELIETMTRFHRDTLMSWHQKGCGDFLQPLFHVIVSKGTHDDIKTLINEGIDLMPNTLQRAIKRKDLAIVKTMVDHGANVFDNHEGLVNLAYESACLDIVKFLQNTKDEKERAAGLKKETPSNWVALSETFAEFSRPQSPDGSQLKYQIDFETCLISLLYQQNEQITPSAVITFAQLDNPELLKTAADMIEKSGYKRPEIGPYTDRNIHADANLKKITSISRTPARR